MKYFKAVVLILTAVALTVGIIGKFFITDEEKDDVLADAPDTEAGDYSRFATGSPLFSENEILISAKSVILCTDGGMLLYEKQADVPQRYFLLVLFFVL